MATFYLALYPTGITPTWSIGSGWSGTPVYTDADTDPGTGATYQFVPDASGLPSGTQLVPWAVWYDGTTTVGPVAGTTFETLAATSSVSSDLSGSYRIRGTVSSDLPGTFTARSTVSNALEGSWAVRSAVSSDLSGGYEVLSANTVSSDLSGAYAVRGSVSADLSGSYQVGDGYSISPSQAALLYNLYRLHGLAEPLTVSHSSREVASLQQQVTSLGGASTIETISLPAEVPLNPGLLIEELAALHGLTAPLTVTSEGRTAGAIVQSFSSAGNLTVITRQ